MSEQRKKPEATIVTTLTVTHILRDCGEKEACELAETLADYTAAALKTAYAEREPLHIRPDDVSVSSIQVFGFDGESREESTE